MAPTKLPVVFSEVSRGSTYRPEEISPKLLRLAARKILTALDKRMDKRKSDLFRPFERAVLDYHMQQLRATSVEQIEAADTAFRKALTDVNITLTFN
jgi:hypothetical protein